MAKVDGGIRWLVLLALIIAGCSNNNSPGDGNNKVLEPVPPESVNPLVLQQAENCDDLKSYIVTSIIKRNTIIPKRHYYYCPDPGTVTEPPPETVGPEVPVDDVTGGNGNADTPLPEDVSETNNQERGVNEGDIVKADERGIVYVLSGRHLVIARGFPPEELTTLNELDLGARGMSLFLDEANQRAIVLARNDAPYYVAEPVPATTDVVIYPPPHQDHVVVLFIDVSSPQQPAVIDEIRINGYFREGRRIEDRLHLVLNHYYSPDELYRDQEFWNLRREFWDTVWKAQCADPNADPESIAAQPEVAAAKENLTARITTVLANLNVEDYLPSASRQLNDDTPEPLAFLSCSDVHHPEINTNLGLQVIASVDTDGRNLSASAVVNTAWYTYASKDNMYLAETSWNWWWERPQQSAPTSQTAIYKFAISKDKPRYVATGSVAGFVNNQFSFSEYQGELRVATTQDDVFYDIDESSGNVMARRERNNNLYVLRDDGEGALNVIGEVRGFGENETIQSSRFFGERGFIVTFRQIDPLFTFDLSQPDKPQLMGELTIPGFSRYLHQYDDNHIFTIGRAGVDGGTGVGTGIQLQLFDVSDLRDPILLDAYVPQTPGNWSWSAAEYDHKAFTFYKPANLLAIPMQFTPDHASGVFSGIVAFNVSLEDGFSEIGRVDHSDLALRYYCDPTVQLLPQYEDHCINGWYVSWAAPRRSIVMTGTENVYLYTISDVGMKAADMSDLRTNLGSILFPMQPYPWFYYRLLEPAQPAIPLDGPMESIGVADVPAPL
ncbi:beta-propeller domain-containing protein [Kaarinaea lacus]